MTRALPVLAVLTAAIIAAPRTGLAQAPACGERSAIIERLRTTYGEERTGAGLADSRGVIEVFASSETGTWTIILTMPTGESCLVAAGEGWQERPAPAPGKPV